MPGRGRGNAQLGRRGQQDRGAQGRGEQGGPEDLRRGRVPDDDRTQPVPHGRPDSPGRSEQSPGHLKKAAGARNARDYAPGRAGEAGLPESGDIESGRDLL